MAGDRLQLMGGALLMAASMPRSAGGGGGGGGSVAISDHTIFKGGNGAGTITASVSYNIDGTTTNQQSAVLENWLVSGAASDYDIRATAQSGSPETTGTMGSWLNLGSNRTWSLTGTAGDVLSSTFLIEIGLAGSGTALDSASITLNVSNA